jgi:hypothetical protein
MPKVSVVIPTHDRTKLLMTRSLPSVLAQKTELELDILVIGDDTEPETGAALNALSMMSDERIRFWNLPRQVYPEDPGQRWAVLGLEARNFGYDQADGDYLYELDDDDAALPGAIQTLYEALESGPYDLAYGRSKAFGPDGSVVGVYGNWPPGHFQYCVPGTTLVDAALFREGYRRRYEGSVIRIESAHGKQLACTPEHPIATRHGWVQAEFLDIGMDLVGGYFKQGLVEGTPDEGHMPASAEDVFESLEELAITKGAPWRSLQFESQHAVHGDVHVVAPHWKLLANEVPLRTHPDREFVLAFADMRAPTGPSGGHMGKLLGGLMSAAHGLMGSGRLPRSAIRADPVHNHRGALARGTYRYPSLPEASSHARATYPGQNGQLIGGYPAFVEADQVIDIRRESFSGHVYDFKTSSGAYFADGILTHNCEGAWLSRHDLGYRYDPACIERGLPMDGDRIDRMVEGGVRFTFVDQFVHFYWPNPR